MKFQTRSSLILLVAATSLALAACTSGTSTPPGGPAATGPFAGKTLVVGGMQANIIDTVRADGAFDAKFEEETGATITWIPGEAGTNLAKLIASKGGPPLYDVVFLDNVEQARAIQADVLEKIDPKQLESTVNLPENGYPHPGYGPGWVVIRLGYCINTKAYEDNGIAIPTGIEGWFDPKLAGRIIFPDVGAFGWLQMMPAIAEHYGIAFDQPQTLIDKFKSMQVQSFFMSSSDAQASLQSADAWLAPITDGRCLGLKIAGQPVDLIPLNLNIGGKTYPYAGLMDTWDVVKGSENKDLAMKFIDMMLGESGTTPMVNEFGYLPSRQDLLDKAKSLPDLKPLIGDFTYDQLYFPDYEKFFPYLSDWTDAWNQTFKS